jgi:Tfp pilus assembly protein PilO
MTRNRLNMLLAVVAMVVVALAGFFLGVQPHLAQAASDRTDQVSVDATNRTTAAELARLKDRAKSLPAMKAELAELTTSVPSSANMSSFYGAVDGVAARAGVKVSAITTSDAVAYTAPVAASTAAGTEDSSASATDEATDQATPEPTAASTGAATAPVTDPAISAANFSAIPVSVSVDGSFDQALSFVGGMQDGARLFLVTTVSSSISQDSTDPAAAAATTWTFGGYVYVLTADSDTATKG